MFKTFERVGIVQPRVLRSSSLSCHYLPEGDTRTLEVHTPVKTLACYTSLMLTLLYDI